MWLFLPEGMYSISLKPDSRVVQVRARKRKHLEDLFGNGAVGHPKIHKDSARDYEYRAYISKGELNDLMAAVIGRMNYSNFKERAQEVNDKRYANFLNAIWFEGHQELGNNWKEYIADV